MQTKDWDIALKFHLYFACLVAVLLSFYLLVSGLLDVFYAFCFFVVSCTGVLILFLRLCQHAERIRDVFEMILPKKVNRRLKHFFHKFTKE